MLSKAIRSLDEQFRGGARYLLPNRRLVVRILDLCAGRETAHTAMEGLLSRYKNKDVAITFEYLSLETKAKFEPSILGDVLNWRTLLAGYEKHYFDVIWASPECKFFSRAKTNPKPNPEQVAGAVRQVQSVKDCIAYFDPPAWFIENSDNCLQTMEFMDPNHCPLIGSVGVRLLSFSHCHYGGDCRKHTVVWTNVGGFKVQRCTKDNECHWLKSIVWRGCHAASANAWGKDGLSNGTPGEVSAQPPVPALKTCFKAGIELASAVRRLDRSGRRKCGAECS
jgi:hypothetical protein